jgi:nitrate/TMAO reductase-like tetraheme cytochrome c subunit
MSNSQPSVLSPETKPRRRGLRRLWPFALLAFVVLSLGGFGVGSVLEESDAFCTSCHTAPEQAYFDRAQQAKAGDIPIDLASVHLSTHEQEFNCIACHRGSGNLGDRITSLTLGAKDAVIYFTGNGDPTIEKRTAAAPGLIDRGCVGCHIDTIVVAGFENHFHVKLPSTWAVLQSGVQPVVPEAEPQALTDPRGMPELLDTSVTCLSCHLAHLSGFDFVAYLDTSGTVDPACNDCHIETGKGPKGLLP